MAITYNLISGATLGSNQTNINIGSIPQTFTDLVVRGMLRSTAATTFQNIQITFNNNTNTVYSSRFINMSGGSLTGSDTTNRANIAGLRIPGTSITANTFGDVEIYIPLYRTAVQRCIAGRSVNENDSTTGYITNVASLFRSTTAISSIEFSQPTDQFAAGSSIYLYGITRA